MSATPDKTDYLPGDEVAVGCPACDWESDRIVVGGAPNAAWRCYDRLASKYREHFDRTHRPLFNRLHWRMSAPDSGRRPEDG